MPRPGRASLILGLVIVSVLAGCAGPTAPSAGDMPDDGASATPPAASPSSPSGSRFPTTIPAITGSTATPSAPAAPSPVAPYTFITTMQGNSFEHPRLDISPGATIVWQNIDLATHSVIGEPGGFVGSGPIAPGSSFSQTFERAGEYAFHCRYHAGMTGLVVVA